MQPKQRKLLETNVLIYIIAVVVVIGVFIVKLAWMQIIDVESYQLQASKNRTRLMPITASRGNIISSDGVVLATDRPSFQVVINQQEIKSKEDRGPVIATLAEILQDPEITEAVIEEKIKNNVGRIYQPIVIKKGLSIETVSEIEARRDELPGVSIESTTERQYLQGDIAGHVVGYIGEVSPEELEAQSAAMEPAAFSYYAGDYIGKIGLEKYYDTTLRGVDGHQRVEVDVHNNPIGEIETVKPQAGDSLILSIDYELQLALEEAFDEVLLKLQANPRSDKADAGAAILMNPKTGEILAMVSRPNDKVTQQNRAIQGRYIPGSIFKMVTAIAALETGNVTDTEIIYNPGRYWRKPYIGTTAPVGNYNIYSAMAKSDNVYFQEMGYRTGIDGIAYYGEELGLVGPTGIDLAYESKADRASDGLPNKAKRDDYFAWAGETTAARFDKKIAAAEEEYAALLAQASTEEEKKAIEKRRKNEINKLTSQKAIDVKWNTEWHESDTFNIAMGQGRQNYTPLQLVRYVATIANGGTVYQPYVVKEIQDSEGNVLKTMSPTAVHQADISPENMAIVQKAMGRVTEPGGVAYSLFSNFPKDIKVAAKTGTSQPGRTGYKLPNKQYFDGTFVAYAPLDDPEIVFACVVEYGYSGSGSGGIICKKVFEQYFGLNK